ncbi:MAG: SAF domain-containing protein [Nocardioides sp.]|uniref:SAF domain-containing protein n=1 Tax=Nocardioides sp. TaxID=35761 RepID=UPI0039E6960B
MFPALARLAHRLRRRLLAHRRLIAFALATLAAALALQAARPAPPETVTLSVAARDLAAGTVLGDADVASIQVAPGVVPDGAMADPVGERLAAPLRRGEAFTDRRMSGPDLVAGHPGVVAVPVRMSDAGMSELLDVGDRIDLYATDAATGRTMPVATDAWVLGLPEDADDLTTASENAASDGVTNGLQGRLIVIGVASSEVETVTSAGVAEFLTYAYAS